MAKKAKKKKLGFKGQILLVIFLITAVVFIPTTVLLFVGMIPTFVARLTDQTPERVKGLTVGFMNFAGCFPFWLDMVQIGHELETALQILVQPRTIVVMYAAAAAGYLIDISMTRIVAGLMAQRGKSRLAEIQKQQERMVRRWGVEVTGDIPIDQYGFPLERKE